MSEPRTCKQCGKALPGPSGTVGREISLCDDACRHLWIKGKHRRKYPLEPRPCRQCGTLFTPEHGANYLCSPECKALHARAYNARYVEAQRAAKKKLAEARNSA